MKTSRYVLGAAAASCLALTAACAPNRSDADGDALALHGRIVDGTGADAIEDGVVVVVGDRIVCAGPKGECIVPRGAEEVRVTDGTILPGLIDLHTHARPHYLAWFLEAGVTTIRDANNSLDMIETMLSHDGYRPRIVWSGPLLDGERSVMSFFGELRGPFDGPMGDMTSVRVRTPEEARAAVDTMAQRGAGVIKLYEQLDHDVFAAAVERARERGIRTMADLGLPGTRGLAGAEIDALEAAAAGVGSIEHASGYSLAYRRLGGDVAAIPYDDALIDRMARATVAAGVAVVPTLSVSYAYSDDVTNIDGLPASGDIPTEMQEFFEGGAARRTEASRERSLQGYAMAAAVARRVRELGGLVGAGSDTPAGVFNIPGGGLHRELELMVHEGATPLQAVHSATGVAANILGRDDIGVIRADAMADILIVDGKPDEDILHTRRIRGLIQGGKWLPLDAMRSEPPEGP